MARTIRIKTETYILPSYWASALINADYSGIEESEINELNDWIKKTNPGYCVGCSEESYFAHSNDANNLGSDVLEFYFHKAKQVRTIDKVITNVNGKYGAPMGRANIGTESNVRNGRIYDCAVPMSSDGAYDKGGAYWGIGKQLRVKYTKDLSYIEFYRLGDI